MHVLKGKDVFLGVEIVKLVPLCRRTSHQTNAVFLGEGVVEQEVVVPEIGERLVVALVS